ncbi:SPOR domain-containing protein [Roseiarcaceae bacterium H3SJ34-1]|uniref:SPOR domain-containing protein n=1 Tax=Terripilifer ovatus TaxID=3032367 RepID=UPI003AB97CFE|nr:SPOR domain-containing protein [Roseiarcaceae bacterium H3SJ34-1]
MDAIRRQFHYLRSTLGHNAAPRRLPGLPGPAGVADHKQDRPKLDRSNRTEAVAAVHERRPLIGHPSMIALLIALGAVVGAKFLASTERVQLAATPTIMAGPNYKFQPDLTGTTPAGLTGGAKVANTRTALDQTGSISKTVGATPAAASPAAQTPGVATARLASNSYFPEPKLVKAVTTDGRGRIITPNEPIAVRPEALPAAQAAAAPVTPKVAAAAPAAPVTVAKLEKTTVRADMPPYVEANVSTAAQAPAAQAPVAAAPVAPAAPVVAAAAVPSIDSRKPANVAETASFGRSTGVSVQIAAAQTEEEARAVADRFEQRFAYELDGRKLSIIQAMPKDKVVYRVRLTEVSRNEADTICGQLRANRIGCFVARD